MGMSDVSHQLDRHQNASCESQSSPNWATAGMALERLAAAALHHLDAAEVHPCAARHDLRGASQEAGAAPALAPPPPRPSALLCLILPCLLLMQAWLTIRPLQRWRLRRIPGPVGVPLLGALPDLLSKGDVYEFAAHYSEKYTKAWQVRWHPPSRLLSRWGSGAAGMRHPCLPLRMVPRRCGWAPSLTWSSLTWSWPGASPTASTRGPCWTTSRCATARCVRHTLSVCACVAVAACAEPSRHMSRAHGCAAPRRTTRRGTRSCSSCPLARRCAHWPAGNTPNPPVCLQRRAP